MAESETKKKTADEEAVETVLTKYAQAYKAGDEKKLAEHRAEAHALFAKTTKGGKK